MLVCLVTALMLIKLVINIMFLFLVNISSRCVLKTSCSGHKISRRGQKNSPGGQKISRGGREISCGGRKFSRGLVKKNGLFGQKISFQLSPLIYMYAFFFSILLSLSIITKFQFDLLLYSLDIASKLYVKKYFRKTYF